MKFEHFIGFFFLEQELFLMRDEVLEDVMIPFGFRLETVVRFL